MNPLHRSTLRSAGLVAALLPFIAGAAELEPIQVLSRLGEPFVAEVRVTDLPPGSPAITASSPPASAYARVGIARPRGAAASLQYAIRTGADGLPVIRITSSAPVTDEFMTFLVQMDWSHGSLVREFSVALQDTVPAAALPTTRVTETPAPEAVAPAASTEAPVVDPAEVTFDPPPVDIAAAPPAEPPASAPPIPLAPPPAARAAVREQPPAPATPSAPVAAVAPIRVTAVDGTRRAPAQAQSQPAASTPTPPVPVTPATAAPRRVVAATSTAPSSTPAVDTQSARSIGPIGRGSTLTGVAREAVATDVPLETALVGLLLANPEAFAGGNINRLQQGATLDVPSAATLAAIDPALARQVVALQADAWRSGATDAQQAALAKALTDIAAGLTPARKAVVAEPRVAPARLQIVAPDDARAPGNTRDAPRAGSPDPGLAAETLAARDMEIQDLRKRVADLERDTESQRKVIALQNNAIGSAQAHLQPGGQDIVGRVAGSMWTWGALLLGLVVAAFAWRRGRPVNVEGGRRSF